MREVALNAILRSFRFLKIKKSWLF